MTSDPHPDGKPRRPLHLTPSMMIMVAVGGAVGTAARASLTLAGALSGVSAELCTLLINLTGCLVLGLLLELLLRAGPDRGVRRRVRLLVGTGFCGGFTTYSTLALAVSERLRSGAWLAGAGYAVGSLVLGLIAVTAGILLGSVLVRPGPESRT